MKAKVITVILGIALLLTMTGCGNVDSSVSTSVPEPAMDSESTTTPASTADNKAATAPESAADNKATTAPIDANEPTSAPAAADEPSSDPAATTAPLPTSSSASKEKDDYQHDLDALIEFSLAVGELPLEDLEHFSEFCQTLLKILDMKTPEGQAIKSDYESTFKLMDRAISMVNDPANIDENEFEQMSNELYELSELAEQHGEAFEEAARKAGVSESEIKKLYDLLEE